MPSTLLTAVRKHTHSNIKIIKSLLDHDIRSPAHQCYNTSMFYTALAAAEKYVWLVLLSLSFMGFFFFLILS